jgi:DNA-binding NarL/FixJ family response regulator
MHDGLSFTKLEAIQRHQGQAADVTTAYNALSDEQKSQILTKLIVTKPEAPIPTGVLIVDDNRIFREALTELLKKKGNMRVVGQADNARDALQFLTRAPQQVGIVLVDVTLKGRSGLELIKDMKAHGINIPALVLSKHDELLYAERSLRSGAKGYISKNSGFADVILAMRSVLRGEIYLSADIALKILTGVFAAKGLTGVGQLTDRELEIFRLIGSGAPTREIAELLHLGVPTVETYRRRIKTKLRLQSGSKLSHEAFRWVESGEQRFT